MEKGIGVLGKIRLMIVAVIFAILIVLSGIVYYKFEKKKTQVAKYDDLTAIAKLKIDEIVQWKKERLSEAIFFSHNENVINQTIRLLHGNTDACKLISKEIVHILSNKRYENVFIIDTNGTVVYTIDSTFRVIDDFTLDLAHKAIKSKDIVFSDFFRSKGKRTVYIDFIAPLLGKENTVFANLVFRVNPEDYLYPLIQSWPTPSKTAETLIVRKDSDSVVFLNRLKHSKADPLTLKNSIRNINIPAVRAVLGNEGVFEGGDYRGEKVLSVLRKIPDSPWFMVSKVDQDEIYSDLYSKAFLVSVVAFVALLLVFSIIAWTYEYKQRNVYKELFEKRSELFKSQEEFRATLYSIGDGVITTDRLGVVKQMNPVAERLTGWLEKDAKGRKLEEIFCVISEATRKAVANPVERVLKEGLVVGLANHTLLISKNGNEIPIADSGAPIRDEESKVVGVVLVFRDQTEERRQRKALEESRERFAHLFERAPLGYQSLDEDGNLIEVNQAWLITLGYTAEEVVGKWFGDLLSPSYVDAFKERFPLFKKLGKIHSEFEMIHKNGEIKYIAFDGRIGYKEDGSFEKTHCILQDITIQRKINQKLFDSEERFRLVLESSKDAILITIPDGRILTANKTACEMFGMTEEELCRAGRDGITKHDESLDELLKSREKDGSAKGEITMIRKNGEHFPVELSSSVFYTSKGDIHTSIVIRDITERKLMEENLRKSEEKFRNIFDQHVAVKLIIDPESGNILDANHAASAFYGWSLEELKKMNISQINTLKIQDINKRMNDALSYNENVFEFKHRKADNSVVDVEVYSSKVKIHDKFYLHSIVHDITDKKKAEEELKISRNKVTLILNSAAEGIYGKDLNGNCIFCNSSALRMLGYSNESDLIGKNIHNLIHYKHKDNTLFPEKDCLVHKVLMDGEEVHIHDDLFWDKNGNGIPVEYWSHPILNENKIIGSVVTFIDITERQKGESERFKLLNILENSLNEIYIFDSETLKFEYLNRCALKNIGYSIDEIKNLTPVDIKPELTIETFKEIINPLLFGEKEIQIFQTKHKRKDGSTYPVEVHLQLHKVDSRRIFFAVIDDITEQKKLEEDRIQNEKRLSSIYDTVGDILYYIAVEQDNKFRFITINNAFCRVTGLTEELVVGKLVNDIIPEPSLSMVLAKYNEAIKEHQIVRWEETSNYPSGTLIGDVSIAPVYDNNGKCTNLVGSVHDITERRLAENELIALKNSLEEKVLEKTKELQARISDLEEFHEATINRELRMKELKDEIERLKGNS